MAASLYPKMSRSSRYSSASERHLRVACPMRGLVRAILHSYPVIVLEGQQAIAHHVISGKERRGIGDWRARRNLQVMRSSDVRQRLRPDRGL
jgi:hypothetical protein